MLKYGFSKFELEHYRKFKFIACAMLFLSIFGIFASNIAHSDSKVNKVDTIFNDFYISIDASATNMKMRKNYGENLFNKHPVEYGVQVGAKFTDVLGLEVGCIQQMKKIETGTVLRAGDYFPGYSIANTVEDIYESTFSGRNIYFAPYISGNPMADDKRLELQLLIGANWGRPYAKLEKVKSNGVLLSQANRDINTYTFVKTQVTPIVKVSAAYSANPIVAFYLFASWKNYGRMSAIKSKQDPLGDARIRLKDNYAFGLGVRLRPFNIEFNS